MRTPQDSQLPLHQGTRRRATLPRPSDRSTIAATGLSFQVRNGNWASPRCYNRRKSFTSHNQATAREPEKGREKRILSNP